MELVPPNLNIDFLRWSRWAMVLSIVVAALGIGSLVVRGPNYGIDFAGGLLLHLRFSEPREVAEVRSALAKIERAGASIQDFGGEKREFLVRMPLEAEQTIEASAEVRKALEEHFGEGSFEILRTEIVGPRVGAELRRRAVLLVAFATLLMGGYIAARFEPRFGLGAAAALVHDVVITLGALSLFRYELDLPVVAALLTVVGYSVNDTVVVSDRIRENRRKSRREPLRDLINRSVNETLSRTVLTSGTTLFVVLALFLLGGNVIHPFAFTLLVGVIVGTYSSVYVASPVVLALERTVRGRR
ncbi:MAG: protein-export membrane protein SecF [Candidatus Binatia bacterium]|nr:MAG: protein-export membrane protein SecF [Candidatus Binatia bacterium]